MPDARPLRHLMSDSLARGLALGLALAFSVDAVVAATSPGRHAWLWLDLQAWGTTTGCALSLALASALLLVALMPAAKRSWRERSGDALRWAQIAAALTLAAAALWAIFDALRCVRLLAQGVIHARVPLPLSLPLAVALAGLARRTWRQALADADPAGARWSVWRRGLVILPSCGVAVAALALGQMLCFGGTDYRRPADAVVVLGARVYADGTPSLALADRVRTGCQLIREGRAELLIVSGGPGDGGQHETDAMRRLALEYGVPADAILMDRGGLNTRHTARNASAVLKSRGIALGRDLSHALVVSHSYHLPRVRMAFEDAGMTAYTVPAEESRTLLRLPYYMAREVAAFWVYYLRAATSPA